MSDLVPVPCQALWASHGCDLPEGHEGEHQCLDPDGTVCSEPNHAYGQDPESVFYLDPPPWQGAEWFKADDRRPLLGQDVWMVFHTANVLVGHYDPVRDAWCYRSDEVADPQPSHWAYREGTAT